MEIPSKYNPQSTESQWYEYWMKNGKFIKVSTDMTLSSDKNNLWVSGMLD